MKPPLGHWLPCRYTLRARRLLGPPIQKPTSTTLVELLKARIFSFRNRGYCGHDSVAPAVRAVPG